VNIILKILVSPVFVIGGPETTTTTTTITTTASPLTTSSVPDSCRFEYPGKGVIDFSFIGRTDEKAAYTDETTRTVSNFSMFI
jgi:hypothetical protein